MNSFLISICIGVAAAVLDVIPMAVKKLDHLFIASAFSLWLIIGIVNARLVLLEIPVLNGLLVTFLFFIPLSFLIYRLDSSAFIQVCVSTVVLGSLVGFATGILIN
ncbi:MAG: hypothetical protein PQJ58_19080 [Spirochaetales bacterium]|nr:hypothetical protein [Spirochaetales bacterium]